MKKYYIPVLFSSLVAMSFSIGSISEAVSNPIFNSQKPAEEIVPEKVKREERKARKSKREGFSRGYPKKKRNISYERPFF